MEKSIHSYYMLPWLDWLVGFGLVSILFFDLFWWVDELLCTGYGVGEWRVFSFCWYGVLVSMLFWCFIILSKMYLVGDLLQALMILVVFCVFQIFVVYFHEAFLSSLLFSIFLGMLLFLPKLLLSLVHFFVPVTPVFFKIRPQLVVHRFLFNTARPRKNVFTYSLHFAKTVSVRALFSAKRIFVYFWISWGPI